MLNLLLKATNSIKYYIPFLKGKTISKKYITILVLNH